ncbi:MAG: NeuD/PglB/VioB family sugar acetyltransferase [Bacteroidaceae bacterium]|nr:NeuD/PglB/VioB family sugar acetyltransferase [Bacteroidaceae bacterium]
MKDIAVFGAGGFGREVACLINQINKENPIWNIIGFFDDNPNLQGTRNEYGEVLGGIDTLKEYDQELAIAIAIGNPSVVRKVVDGINNDKVWFPNLVAPDAVIMDDANYSMGYGNIICSKCWISCNVHFGDFNILNVGCIIGHDVKFGNYNSLMPSVNISGEVIVGEENYFGVASVVLQQKKIGCKTVIGGNSMIIKNTKDGRTYMGNPASAL